MATEYPMLSGECPRCGQSHTTFDILAETTSSDEQLWKPLELFARCRACYAPSTALVTLTSHWEGGTEKLRGNYIDILYQFVRWIFEVPSRRRAPEHVPANVKAIFDEAATCAAVGAWNASGAMYRKVLDAATRGKIAPPDAQVGTRAPNWKVYKDLRLRLDWLFDNNLLDHSLQDLSGCIHQDGNDAAHDEVGISENEANDLADFTERVLEIIYTFPGQIEANKRRRDERRASSVAA